MEIREICVKQNYRILLMTEKIIYKDAIEYEFRENNILFSREKKYKIQYKETILPRHYNADFVVYDKIILEVKAIEC